MFDEPTSALDPDRALIVAGLLRALREPGPNAPRVVVAAHDPVLLQALLGRVDRARYPGLRDFVFWLGPRGAQVTAIYPERGDGAFDARAWVPVSRDGGGDPEAARFRDATRRLVGGDTVETRPAHPSGVRWAMNVLPKLPMGDRELRVPRGLSVRPGTIHLVRGPSGVGKSTFLRHLLRLPSDSVALGFLPQDPSRTWNARATTVEVAGLADGRGDVAREEAVERGFEATGAGGGTWQDRAGLRFGELSEGQRHRLLYAREFARLQTAAAACLLLDEPFGAVDPPRHLEILRTLLEWVSADPASRAVVLITHSVQADASLLYDWSVTSSENSTSPASVEIWDFTQPPSTT